MPACTALPAQTKTARKARPAPIAHSTDELRVKLVELSPELFARALRLSRSPALAEDLVQDTIERAIKFEGHYQAGTNVRAWAYQILFSVFITKCRRSRRERRALDVLGTDPCAWTSNDPTPVMQSLSPTVQSALDSLPKSFRDVVRLVDIEEHAYRDAADKLGVPVGTVMSRLFRGRRQLAALLQPTALAA